jgi:hypothetical protein
MPAATHSEFLVARAVTTTTLALATLASLPLAPGAHLWWTV